MGREERFSLIFIYRMGVIEFFEVEDWSLE